MCSDVNSKHVVGKKTTAILQSCQAYAVGKSNFEHFVFLSIVIICTMGKMNLNIAGFVHSQ